MEALQLLSFQVPSWCVRSNACFKQAFIGVDISCTCHQSLVKHAAAALLDQTLVAGAGNIYADESLFEAGIAPHTPAGQLKREQLQCLHDALVSVLERSIGAGGTTFSDFRDLEGVNGNYGGQASVYRRTDQPCLICGTPIQRDKLVGRSTHWCPKCQH